MACGPNPSSLGSFLECRDTIIYIECLLRYTMAKLYLFFLSLLLVKFSYLILIEHLLHAGHLVKHVTQIMLLKSHLKFISHFRTLIGSLKNGHIPIFSWHQK